MLDHLFFGVQFQHLIQTQILSISFQVLLVLSQPCVKWHPSESSSHSRHTEPTCSALLPQVIVCQMYSILFVSGLPLLPTDHNKIKIMHADCPEFLDSFALVFVLNFLHTVPINH